jgi:hypothetical protein
MDECIHLLDPDTCTICNGRVKKEEKQVEVQRAWDAVMGGVLAQYGGTCSECHEWFNAGEMIVHMVGGWAHVGCQD